jgi:hypothetical protein
MPCSGGAFLLGDYDCEGKTLETAGGTPVLETPMNIKETLRFFLSCCWSWGLLHRGEFAWQWFWADLRVPVFL